MRDFARLSLAGTEPYFQETANRRGLTKLIVEKDFWVCFMLRFLFDTPELSDKIVFKGGTSLSKVFGIIKRFSEDVDLSLDPDWLGFGGENRPDAAPSRSQFAKRWTRLNKACATAVRDVVLPAMEAAVLDVLGFPKRHDSHLAFELDEQTQSPVLTFRYPTREPDSPGYILPQVKLEFGSLTDQRPIGDHSVTPWIAEEFLDQFRDPQCRVVALDAERTFWEKATILHAEYHRPKDKPMRNRLSRDCYDLYCLAAHESGKRALSDTALLERVVRHKKMYFRSSWASYDTAEPGSLHLVPPDHRLRDLRTDYQQMQEMFLENVPGFHEILERIKEVEATINQGAVPGSDPGQTNIK